MSKSAPNEDAPCKLLLFATGLPMLADSKFIMPSLRLRGLDLAGIKQFAPGALESGRGRANSNLIGLSLISYRMTGFCSAPIFSRSSALVFRTAAFSSPDVRLVVKGVALPWSVESAKTRRGLLEVVRFRGDDRKGAERRSVNFFLVVAGAGASGDSG